MSFLRNLTKKKTRFHFFIRIRSAQNIPIQLSSSNLRCGVFRKDKQSATKYAQVSPGGSLEWEETVNLTMSLFEDKNSPTGLDSKMCVIFLQNRDSGEKICLDLDMSLYPSILGKREVEKMLSIPFNDTHSINLNVVIRTYPDGCDLQDATEFAPAHTEEPEFVITEPARPVEVKAAYGAPPTPTNKKKERTHEATVLMSMPTTGYVSTVYEDEFDTRNRLESACQ